MYFSDIQISNYKSYRKSTQLELLTGINIVVGKNNVGKTALLDVLSLQFQANPHRSRETAPNPSILPGPSSCVTLTFTITRRELIDSLIKVQGDTEFDLGLPALESPIAQQLEYKQHNVESVAKFGEWFFSNDKFTFRLKREAYGNHPGENWYILNNSYVFPHVETASQVDSGHYGKFRIDPVTRTFAYNGYIPIGGAPSGFISRLASALKQYIYRFRAERFPSSPCQVGTDRVLAPDASNLAAVLNLLHGNLALFSEYNRLVQEILPEIYQVGTRR
ncbi:MAG TPA: AAA family ATPase, partial [Anaerolineales bacterium]|nr:AAA family ATPase [Anaerolineales bacterium]